MIKFYWGYFTLTLCFTHFLTIVSARTLYVQAGVTGIPNGSLANPYPKIQAAINVSREGDVINVLQGTYRENINFRGKSLTVKAYLNDKPTIVGLGNSCVVLMEHLKGALLEGFIIRGGRGILRMGPWRSNAFFGGGICLRASEDCILRNLNIEDCTAEHGGGISVYESPNAFLEKIKINYCNAGAGGGIDVISSNPLKVTISNSLITNCKADVYGGGINWSYSTNGIIEYTIIANCTSKSGAAIIRSNAARFEAKNCVFWGNSPVISQLKWGGGYTTEYSNIINSIVEKSSDKSFLANNTYLNLISCSDKDPLFQSNTDCNNFNLQLGSPAMLLLRPLRPTGFVFNASKYQQMVKTQNLDSFNETKMSHLVVSLRPYCPTPQTQDSETSCMTWATAYGAMSIQHAVKRQIKGSTNVDKIAYSKSFVHNQLIQKSTDGIPTVEDVNTFLCTQGTCLSATFRNNIATTEKPDDLAIQEAQDFRLKAVQEVFDPDSTIPKLKHIRRLKRLLADSIPVVVGIRLPASFHNVNGRYFIYDDKDNVMDASAHALCLIGYDDIDSTFELMNSWGTEWGDKGFVRIHYQDLITLMRCAYRLILRVPQVADGEIILRRTIGYNAQEVPQFEEVRVQYDSLNKYYQTLQPYWEAGIGFQLALRHIPNNWWVTVFNIDSKGIMTRSNNTMVSEEAIEKVIPNEQVQFKFDEKGTEWLCMIFTKNPFHNFKEFSQKTIDTNPDIIHKQMTFFLKDHISKDISFMSKRMSFTFLKNHEYKGIFVLLKIITK